MEGVHRSLFKLHHFLPKPNRPFPKLSRLDRLQRSRKSLCLALSNRAEARSRLKEFHSALEDCDLALVIDETHFKTLICKGLGLWVKKSLSWHKDGSNCRKITQTRSYSQGIGHSKKESLSLGVRNTINPEDLLPFDPEIEKTILTARRVVRLSHKINTELDTKLESDCDHSIVSILVDLSIVFR
ncbi:hypothetical protein K1719_004141 [Acacia pycnantha]|nr:hypothetical protein K1719_004141 [Acacia pycnantha]